MMRADGPRAIVLAPGALLRRLPAGPKLALLALAGCAAFILADPLALAIAFVACLVLAVVARVPWRYGLAGWRVSALVLLVVVLVHGLDGEWRDGLAAVLRLTSLTLIAAAVTATTRTSDMTEAIAGACRPLRVVGLDPERLALALALALRFLPLIAAEAATIRDAQRARGLDRSPLALFVPLVIRVLKLADDLADAIDARSG